MDEMSATIAAVMCGQCDEGEIGTLLIALRAKGETVAEIAGAASAMRRFMTPIRSHHEVLIDTCGTGGDGSGTFNISTAAALVTAAAGVPVAKHGNRRITSRSGSADVLAVLGVRVDPPVTVVERCLDELGICFCFGPQMHESMKHVGPVRQKLGVPTIFNILGPLTNPAGAPFQLLGVGRPDLRLLLAEALALLGTRRAVVVYGEDALDEVTLSDRTQVAESRGSETASSAVPNVREFVWQPEDFGLRKADKSAMRADGPQTSAAIIREILAGATGPPRDIVVLNAAAALWTAGKSANPIDCAALAAEAIDSGAAGELLTGLARMTNSE